MFNHVDDGLLFGLSIAILRLVELLSNQVNDAHCETNGATGRSKFLSWQSDRDKGPWILG